MNPLQQQIEAWLKSEAKNNYVGDYNGKYDLDSVNLDGWFNLTELIELIEKYTRERIVKIIKDERVKNFGLINSKGEGGAILVEDIINLINKE